MYFKVTSFQFKTNSQTIVMWSEKSRALACPTLVVKFDGVRRVDQTAPRGLFYSTASRVLLFRACAHTRLHIPRALSTGFVCWAKKKKPPSSTTQPKYGFSSKWNIKYGLQGRLGYVKQTPDRIFVGLCALLVVDGIQRAVSGRGRRRLGE